MRPTAPIPRAPLARELLRLAFWWARESWAAAAEYSRACWELARGAAFLAAGPPSAKGNPRGRGGP